MVAYVLSVLISSIAVFVFLVSVYTLLTNVPLHPRDVLPGALISTVALEASFQVLPVYLRVSKDVIALQALGGTALLLVWLYVMAWSCSAPRSTGGWTQTHRDPDFEEAAGLA